MMKDSTKVVHIASKLGAVWTGQVDENHASVVLFWSSGEKVYLDLRDGAGKIGQGSNTEKASDVLRLLTEIS